MSDSPLTQEQILTAAEDVLRRFGPAKTTVVDVARALGVSHGSVYRHFPSKAALRDAVAESWLERVMAPLTAVVAEDGPALGRLRRWLDLLIAAKRNRASSDPELFATYIALATEAREVVQAHMKTLVDQVAKIIADGMAQGEFEAGNPHTTALAVLYATSRFHNPAHAAEWTDPNTDAAFEAVWSLIVNGLVVRKE